MVLTWTFIYIVPEKVSLICMFFYAVVFNLNYLPLTTLANLGNKNIYSANYKLSMQVMGVLLLSLCV